MMDIYSESFHLVLAHMKKPFHKVFIDLQHVSSNKDVMKDHPLTEGMVGDGLLHIQ